MARKRAGTKSRTRSSTSAFGVGKRESHDSGPFYSSRLYERLRLPESVEYEENPIPRRRLDKVFRHTAEDMRELPDASVHLMVTSPPYNVGKEYDENLSLEEYAGFLGRVWREVFRVLVPGGRACVNVANLGRKPYIPVHFLVAEGMLDAGFVMRGEIIWNKAASAGSSTAWGSFCSPANPTLRDVHEYILVFSKETMRRQPPEERRATITKEEFLEYTKSVWTFPTESARKIGHPAPFPVELPRRLIQLYTFEGEVVLDPFMGSGQTALAAVRSGRRFVGYEIKEEYARLASGRIREEKAARKRLSRPPR